MKTIENVRVSLNRAILKGCSEEAILRISKRLDDLIVEQMILQNQRNNAKRRQH